MFRRTVSQISQDSAFPGWPAVWDGISAASVGWQRGEAVGMVGLERLRRAMGWVSFGRGKGLSCSLRGGRGRWLEGGGGVATEAGERCGRVGGWGEGRVRQPGRALVQGGGGAGGQVRLGVDWEMGNGGEGLVDMGGGLCMLPPLAHGRHVGADAPRAG